jgi:Domain of unknown function (DUF4112)
LRGGERDAMAGNEIRTGADIMRWLERAARELGPEEEIALQRVARLAYWLDDRFRIPGTRRRVGIDGLLGFVPGIGDTATALIASYIVLEAARLGVPKAVLARMVANVGIDFVIGLVPLVGDLADLAWKANRRNARMLRDHLLARRDEAPRRVAGRARSRVEPGG